MKGVGLFTGKNFNPREIGIGPVAMTFESTTVFLEHVAEYAGRDCIMPSPEMLKTPAAMNTSFFFTNSV
jgi:hypothetical protein